MMDFSKYLSRPKRLLGWISVGFCFLASVGFAADTNQPPSEATPPKSIFIDDPLDPASRDPFFPTSSRRRPKPPVTTPTNDGTKTTPTTTPRPAPSLAGQLSLNAIFAGGGNRIAIINDTRFRVGQTANVYVNPNLTLKVHCLEIGTGSVKVRVGDETEPKELKLE